MKQDVRTVALDPERSLYAAMAGAGEDIVLLHGAMTTHRDWLDGPFGALARLGRVIAIDRPGHGRSRRPRFSGDPRLQASQIREGLRALEVERPVLVGHSFGCLCALAYAELFPDEVAGLVLVAPLAFPEWRPLEHGIFAPRATPLFGPAWAKMTPGVVDRAMLELIHRVMFLPASPSEQWRRNYPWAQILAQASMVANAEDSATVHPLSSEGVLDLRSIHTPTRIISGTADVVVAESRQAGLLQATLPDAAHVRIEGAGHMLHQSHPEAVIEAVRDMVRGPAFA